MAIAANRRMPTHAGPIRVDALPALIPTHAWQTHSAGAGAHGPRLYSWAWFRLLPEDDTDTGVHHLLIRRNDTTGEHAYLRCYSPRPMPLHTLVAVAGQRWRIEESFQAAKGLVGLDQHQVRRWTSWHRWTTLAMLAHAFLAVATATERDTAPTPTGLITLTVNEFRRLFDALLLAAHHTITTLLAWSRWRRQHQYRARLPLPTTAMIPIYGCSTSRQPDRSLTHKAGHRRQIAKAESNFREGSLRRATLRRVRWAQCALGNQFNRSAAAAPRCRASSTSEAAATLRSSSSR